MDAYDSLVPENKVTMQVRITVRRNQGFPSFDQTSYNIAVDELHALSILVLNVTATDAESVSSDFSLILMLLNFFSGRLSGEPAVDFNVEGDLLLVQLIVLLLLPW